MRHEHDEPTPDEIDDEHEHESSFIHFRVAFLLVAILIVGIVLTFPLAVRSVFYDLYTSVEGESFAFDGLSPKDNPKARNRVHVSIVGLDESKLTATLRVSGHRVCPAADCTPGDRIILFALGTDEAVTAGMPPSGSVDILTGQQLVTSNVDLPVRGHPTLYPFDTYELWLGVGMGEIVSNQVVRPLTREESAGLLAVTIQDQLPREDMAPPVSMPPSFGAGVDDPYQLQGLQVLRFSRPLYERVLAVLLVLLVAAAAAYAVFMRPLHDLVLNSGGLVLGVWGIRSILSPGTASRTLVDLALSLVILFLLSAITFRALQFLHMRGRMPSLRHARHRTGAGKVADEARPKQARAA
jgi:hypothetical protein